MTRMHACVESWIHDCGHGRLQSCRRPKCVSVVCRYSAARALYTACVRSGRKRQGAASTTPGAASLLTLATGALVAVVAKLHSQLDDDPDTNGDEANATCCEERGRRVERVPWCGWQVHSAWRSHQSAGMPAVLAKQTASLGGRPGGQRQSLHDSPILVMIFCRLATLCVPLISAAALSVGGGRQQRGGGVWC